MANFRLTCLLILGVIAHIFVYWYLYNIFGGLGNSAVKNRNVSKDKGSIASPPRTPILKNFQREVHFGNATRFRWIYLINNPFICSSADNLTFIVVVHSDTRNFNKRHGIRQTWANPNHYNSFTFRRVFFVGRTTDESVQYLIEEENRQFQDMIQGDFLDTYNNLTLKAIVVYHWLSEFCNQAQVVLKTDDDVFVNMFNIVELHLHRHQKYPRQIACPLVIHGRIRREKREKWWISPNELPGMVEYPTYCQGYLVLISSDLIKPMLQKVPSNAFFWIDDVYIYGFLPEFLQVSWHKFVPRVPKDFATCQQSYKSLNETRQNELPVGCLNIANKEQMIDIWVTVLRNLPKSSMPLLHNHTWLTCVPTMKNVISLNR